MKKIVSLLAATSMAVALATSAHAGGVAAGKGEARASSGPLLGLGLAGLLIPAAVVAVGVTAVAVAASNDDDDNDDGAVVQTNNGIGVS